MEYARTDAPACRCPRFRICTVNAIISPTDAPRGLQLKLSGTGRKSARALGLSGVGGTVGEGVRVGVDVGAAGAGVRVGVAVGAKTGAGVQVGAGSASAALMKSAALTAGVGVAVGANANADDAGVGARTARVGVAVGVSGGATTITRGGGPASVGRDAMITSVTIARNAPAIPAASSGARFRKRGGSLSNIGGVCLCGWYGRGDGGGGRRAPALVAGGSWTVWTGARGAATTVAPGAARPNASASAFASSPGV